MCVCLGGCLGCLGVLGLRFGVAYCLLRLDLLCWLTGLVGRVAVFALIRFCVVIWWLLLTLVACSLFACCLGWMRVL